MVKSIKKNYFYNLVFQLLTIIIPIITTPYLSRVLGVHGIGVSSYTLSIVSYFIIFGSVGVASYGQREIAMNRDNKKQYSETFWGLFLLKAFMSLISLIVYIFLIIFIKQYNIIFLILILNIFASIFDISWFYQGLEEYKFISVRNIIIKLLFATTIFVFVNDKNDLGLYILLNSLSLIISSFALWIRLPKLVEKLNVKKTKIFSHFKNTLIYFLPQIATQIYTVLDKIMLGIITKGQIENGYYEQAHKIVLIALTIITSLNVVVAPRMAYLYKNKKSDEIKTRLLRSMQFSCFLAIPMMIGLSSISYGFVDWFFGVGYDKVKILLIMFSPIVLFISLSNCLGTQYLTPCGMRTKSAIVLWCGAVINFIMNLILIPKFASIGAVLASITAELIITILYFKLSKKCIKFLELMKKIYKYFISSIIMGLSIVLISNFLNISLISTLLEIFIGCIIYFSMLILLRDNLAIEFYNYFKRIVRCLYEKIKFKR